MIAPTLSVVIPVKDDAVALARCLEALRGQSDSVFEVIVVDNGSTDDSALVARRFGATLLTETSPGIAAAASAGYDAAAGTIIGRLDADSVPDPDWSSEVLRFLNSHPTVAAVTGGARFTDGPRRLRRLGAAVYLGAYFVAVSTALAHVPLFGSNFAMRATDWRRISGAVHRGDLLVHDDMDVSFHLGPVRGIRYGSRVRVGISSRPLTDGRGGLRARRGIHTILAHWPRELPWLRAGRRLAGAARRSGISRSTVPTASAAPPPRGRSRRSPAAPP